MRSMEVDSQVSFFVVPRFLKMSLTNVINGTQDLKKAKLYSKIGKEVISAVKKGGPNLVSNSALATLLDKAKELDVPKEIIEPNIKRGQEVFIEKFYEVYGFGSVGIVVEVLTDKVNRSVAAIREVVKNCVERWQILDVLKKDLLQQLANRGI